MKIKCLNCIHYSTCDLRMSGLDIKILNENCKDYIEDKTKDIEVTMPNIKCYNCIHNKICFNLIGGMNLQMKAEDCKDFLEIDKDVLIAPCKRGDNLYIIDGEEIYSATVLCIEASLMPNDQISWSIKVSYLDEYLDMHYTWETWNYKLFKTKEEAERSDLYVWNKKLYE